MTGFAITDVAAYRGMLIEYVSVPDITDHPHHADTHVATKAEIAHLNKELQINHDWPAPGVEDDGPRKKLQPNNPVAESLFATAPGLKRWREELVPTAVALTALYEAESWCLPTGEAIDAKSRAIFIHALDAVGVRTRAAIMCDLAARYVGDTGTSTRWTSIACGGAIPVLTALEAHAVGGGAELTLVDIDPSALDHARSKALERGLIETEHFHLLERNIVRDLIISDNLVQELGHESQNLVDMLGIFEYIDEDYRGFRSAAAFLRNAFRLVKPGGALVAANMLDTHPQLHFNQRAIGWPRIFPRSVDQIHAIVTAAGIAPAQVTMRIPEDGIYAVFEIRKSGAQRWR